MCIRFCLIGLALVHSLTAEELRLDFGLPGTNGTPPGFTNALAGRGRPGSWRVIAAEDLNSSNRVALAQTSMDVTDERFPMLIYRRVRFDDFTLTTKFKLVEGIAEQMAGIVFRYQDEKDFYVVRASGLGRNVRFYKVVGGIRSQPIGATVPLQQGEWYELRIRCEANKIQAWVNGQEVIPELIDTSFSSGFVGYWTKSDSVSHFADTRIEYTPREPFAQVLVREVMTENSRLRGLRIYRADPDGTPRIVASNEPVEVGQPGGNSERGAIARGEVYCGREPEKSSVVQPLRDRNGDPIAAVRVELETFPGQTEQAILQRALPIVRSMQQRVLRREDLD